MVAVNAPISANTNPDAATLISHLFAAAGAGTPDIGSALATWPNPVALDVNSSFITGSIVCRSGTGDAVTMRLSSASITHFLSPSQGVNTDIDAFAALGSTSSPSRILWPDSLPANPFRYDVGISFLDRRIVPGTYLTRDAASQVGTSNTKLTSLLSASDWGYVQNTLLLFPGQFAAPTAAFAVNATPLVAQDDQSLAGWSGMTMHGGIDELFEVDVLYDEVNKSVAAATDAYLIIPIPGRPISSFSTVVTTLENYIGINGSGPGHYTSRNSRYAGSVGAIAVPLAALVGGDTVTIPVGSALGDNNPMLVSSESTGTLTRMQVNWDGFISVSITGLPDIVTPTKVTNYPPPNFI